MNGRKKNTEMTLFMKIAFYTLFVLMLGITIVGTIMLPGTLPVSYAEDGSVTLALSKFLLIPVCAALVAIGAGLMALTKLSFKAGRGLGWFMFIISAVIVILMDSIVGYCIVAAL